MVPVIVLNSSLVSWMVLDEVALNRVKISKLINNKKRNVSGHLRHVYIKGETVILQLLIGSESFIYLMRSPSPHSAEPAAPSCG